MYMLALGLEKGRLWNVRTNEMVEITIPSKKKLLNSIARTISKRGLSMYYHARGKANVASKKNVVTVDDPLMHEYFAVLDASFTWNQELMAFGVVIADKYSMKPVAAEYYVIEENARKSGPDSDGLYQTAERPIAGSRQFVMQQFTKLLWRYKVSDIFTYSRHDREYWAFRWINNLVWHDVERLTGEIIKQRCLTLGPGDLNRERMHKIITGKIASGLDNALTDAVEELTMLQKSKLTYPRIKELTQYG
jgi:hypothetical protein